MEPACINAQALINTNLPPFSQETVQKNLIIEY